jgi:thymidylate synthase (FAD)
MSPEVKLTWATQDAEPLLVEMARVSAPKNAKNMDTGPRLLNYLIKHKHWSPFEMANMCVEIHTTRAISPQILRHRSFSFQEFSQRYANTNEIGRIELPHLRVQDYKNRQNSTDNLADVLGKPATADLYRRVAIHFEDAEHLYQELISSGVAKESARFVLPTAAPTKMFMNGNLRSWIHYIDLRTHKSTQLEHREIALMIKDIFKQQFPITAEAAWQTTYEVSPM